MLELAEGDLAAVVLGLALPEVGNLVLQAAVYMAVDAVEADVELAAQEPLRIRRLPLVELRPRLEEGDALRLLGPELVQPLAVDARLGVGLIAETGVGRVAALFDLEGLDGMAAWRHVTHSRLLESACEYGLNSIPSGQYGSGRLRGAARAATIYSSQQGVSPGGSRGSPKERSGVQQGVVGLRGALVARWEDDLRAVRQEALDVGRGREALVFIQRFYGLISDLRQPIQQAWGPGGHVHVVDSPDLAGPGPRVSQSRIRLRNHGEVVAVELFSYADGDSRANHAAGLDREIRVADAEPLFLVTELYRTAVDFLQVALNVDLRLNGSTWLYEHIAASHFVSEASWPTVAEVYRLATREFAVGDSFESVAASIEHHDEGDGGAGDIGANGSNGNGATFRLSLDRLQRFAEPQADLERFIELVHVAVAADQEEAAVD